MSTVHDEMATRITNYPVIPYSNAPLNISHPPADRDPVRVHTAPEIRLSSTTNFHIPTQEASQFNAPGCHFLEALTADFDPPIEHGSCSSTNDECNSVSVQRSGNVDNLANSPPSSPFSPYFRSTIDIHTDDSPINQSLLSAHVLYETARQPEPTPQVSLLSTNTSLFDVDVAPASSPPTSSPPHLFSSSPLPSSQSSEPPEAFQLENSQSRSDNSNVPEPASVNPGASSPKSQPASKVSCTTSSSILYTRPPPSADYRLQSPAELILMESDNGYEQPASSPIPGCENIFLQTIDNTSKQTPESSLFSTCASEKSTPTQQTLQVPLPNLPRFEQSESALPTLAGSAEILIGNCDVDFTPPPARIAEEKTPNSTGSSIQTSVLSASTYPGKRGRGGDQASAYLCRQPAHGVVLPFVFPSGTCLPSAKENVSELEIELPTKSQFPNPRRSTMAAQKLQHKKLATPFRSPVLKRPKLDPKPSDDSVRTLSMCLEDQKMPTVDDTPNLEQIMMETTDTKKRHRTQRAASQFKSPLSSDASLSLVSSIRLTPTIQALERKLQTLRRAVKVKHDGDEEVLERLTKKWKEAGREVAWGVWELVKDSANSEDQSWVQGKGKTSNKRPFEDGWGWCEKSDHKKATIDEKERNWGWDVTPNGNTDDGEADHTAVHEEISGYTDDDEEEKRQDTLGTMLMQLGIAPETLGWNEEEGTFEGE